MTTPLRNVTRLDALEYDSPNSASSNVKVRNWH
jgi:hypothetical protein